MAVDTTTKYVVSPMYRYLFESNQLAQGYSFCAIIKDLCEEEFLNLEGIPSDDALKTFFKQKFSYRLRSPLQDKYPNLISAGTFKKWITQLYSGELDTDQPLIMMHWISCRLLEREQKSGKSNLPEFNEFILAVSPADEDSITDSENVFYGTSKSPSRGRLLQVEDCNNILKIRITDTKYQGLQNNLKDSAEIQVKSQDTRTDSSNIHTVELTEAKGNYLSHPQKIGLTISLLSILTIMISYYYYNKSNNQPSYNSVIDSSQNISLRNFDQLLINAKKNAEENPKNPNANFEYASLLDESQQIDLAKKYYLKALDLDPSFTQAKNNLARIYILNQQENQAINELEFLLSTNNLDSTAQVFVKKNIIWAYLNQNNYLSAQHYLDSLVLDFDSEDIRGIESIIICLTELSDLVKGTTYENRSHNCEMHYKTPDRIFVEKQWIDRLNKDNSQ